MVASGSPKARRKGIELKQCTTAKNVAVIILSYGLRTDEVSTYHETSDTKFAIHSTLPHLGTSVSEGARNSEFSIPIHTNPGVATCRMSFYAVNSAINRVCGKNHAPLLKTDHL